jgi:hypothetical protein
MQHSIHPPLEVAPDTMPLANITLRVNAPDSFVDNEFMNHSYFEKTDESPWHRIPYSIQDPWVVPPYTGLSEVVGAQALTRQPMMNHDYIGSGIITTTGDYYARTPVFLVQFAFGDDLRLAVPRPVLGFRFTAVNLATYQGARELPDYTIAT